jgi:hypothetical protein
MRIIEMPPENYLDPPSSSCHDDREALLNEKRSEHQDDTVPFGVREHHRLRRIIAIQSILIISLLVFAIGAGLAVWTDVGLEIPDMVYCKQLITLQVHN